MLAVKGMPGGVAGLGLLWPSFAFGIEVFAMETRRGLRRRPSVLRRGLHPSAASRLTKKGRPCA